MQLFKILILLVLTSVMRAGQPTIPPHHAELCCVPYRNYLLFVQGPVTIIKNNIILPSAFFHEPIGGYLSIDDYKKARNHRIDLLRSQGISFFFPEQPIHLLADQKLVTASGLEIFMQDSLMMIRIPMALPDLEVNLVVDFLLADDKPDRSVYQGKLCAIIEYRNIKSLPWVPVLYIPNALAHITYSDDLRQKLEGKYPWYEIYHSYSQVNNISSKYVPLKQRIYQIRNSSYSLRLAISPDGYFPKKTIYYVPGSSHSMSWYNVASRLVPKTKLDYLYSYSLYEFDVKSNIEMARFAWQSLYKKGDYRAAFYLGLYHLLKGHDINQASQYFQEALANNCIGAKNNIALCLIENGQRCQGFDVLQAAAKDGIPEAIYNLSILYRNGLCVNKNIIIADIYQFIAVHFLRLPI